MTKALRKAIVKRSRLENIYNKKRSYENWDKYKKHINFCVKPLQKKQKRTTSIILILKVSVKLKKFWKTIKPCFINKGLNSNKIFLSEKGRLTKNQLR